MKNKTVKVRALDDGAGGVEFEVDGVKAKKAVLKLDQDAGDYAIAFQLQDHSGRGLGFDRRDPIWVDEDAPCPPSKGVNSDQIAVTSVEDGSLTATNANSGRPRQLRYQLNFIAADSSRWECDPIIDNGGSIKPGGGGI